MKFLWSCVFYLWEIFVNFAFCSIMYIFNLKGNVLIFAAILKTLRKMDDPGSHPTLTPWFCFPGPQLGTPGFTCTRLQGEHCRGKSMAFGTRQIRTQRVTPFCHQVHDLGQVTSLFWAQVFFVCKSEIIINACQNGCKEWGEHLTLGRSSISGAIAVGYWWLVMPLPPGNH